MATAVKNAVHDLRVERRCSQTQLAAAVRKDGGRLTRSRLARIELGTLFATRDEAGAMAQALSALPVWRTGRASRVTVGELGLRLDPNGARPGRLPRGESRASA